MHPCHHGYFNKWFDTYVILDQEAIAIVAKIVYNLQNKEENIPS